MSSGPDRTALLAEATRLRARIGAKGTAAPALPSVKPEKGAAPVPMPAAALDTPCHVSASCSSPPKTPTAILTAW